MFEKLFTMVTGINPRLILAVGILGLCAWAYMFVHGLQTTIVEKETHIAALQVKLSTQNTAIDGLGKEKTVLESRLSDIKISNGRLANENSRLNDFIDNQVPAKDANEALARISNNAEQLAKTWNGVKK